VDHTGSDRNPDAVNDVLGHDAAPPGCVAGWREGPPELSGLDGFGIPPDLEEREVIALTPFAVFNGHGQAPISRAAR
jgi:hypothetical protein